MATKNVKTRIQHKHDIEANWIQATNFVPLSGELIIYDTHDSEGNRVARRPRIKVGDGISKVNALPFTEDVFYFNFTLAEKCPEDQDRLFTLPYEAEFNIQLLDDCSVEDLFYAANTYKHVVGLFSLEENGITETECLHLIHKSTALLFKGESFLGSGMGLGVPTPAVDSALLIEPADSGYLGRYARCGYDKKQVFINIDLYDLTNPSIYDDITDKFMTYRTLGIDVGLSTDGAQLFLVAHGDDYTVFRSLPQTDGMCVAVALNHTTRRIQAGCAPAIDVSTRKPDEICGGASAANLLISWFNGETYSTASSELTLQDIINLQDGVDGLAHNIKDADGVGSLIQTKDTESWNPTNPQVIDYIADNVGTADDGHKIQVNDDGSIKVGSYGKFATSLNGKSQSLGKKSFTSGSKNIAFESNSHAEGNETFAAGKHSHAEGNTTSAMGNASHSEGISTIAKGLASHAEGSTTNAEGETSHAEGSGTKAIGYASHSEGSDTKAIAGNSHVEGHKSVTYGDVSHTEGYKTSTYGYASHAEGYSSNFLVLKNVYGDVLDRPAMLSCLKNTPMLIATGVASHAEGQDCAALGNFSHAQGLSTVAYSDNQLTLGRYNEIDTNNDYSVVVGNGESKDSRSNAMTVDWDGNAWFAGDLYSGGTKQSEGHKLATEDFVDDYVQRQKGAVDGIAALDSTGKIISSQLPSYVDDIVEVHIKSFTPPQLYSVTGGVQTGRSVLGNNIFSIVNSKNIISNFDPSIGEDLEELHIAHGKYISLTTAAGVGTIQGATGYYTISAEFQDDKSYIEVYDLNPNGLVVIATISASQPSATFYSSTAAAHGTVQLQFKNSLSNTLVIKKLQVSIGEEVLDYQKYEKRYEYINPVTGEYVTADLVTPESGKIYIDILYGANKSYRWSGSALVEISKSLVLGTTSTTAYRGDYGNTAYQHSLKTSGNPHKVTKSNVGLGNVTNDTQVKRSEMGKANGVATLDSSGRIPSAQLPSFVDDVLEGALLYNHFFVGQDHQLTNPTITAANKNLFDINKLISITGSSSVTAPYVLTNAEDVDLYQCTYLTESIGPTLVLSAAVLDGYIEVYNAGTLAGTLDTSTSSVLIEAGLSVNKVFLKFSPQTVIGLIQLERGSAVTSYTPFVANCNGIPQTTPEAGKIYLDINTNHSYRWSGYRYVEISSSLALGETSSTAYAGDKGAQNATDIVILQNQVKDLTDLVNTLSQVQLITWEADD